MTRQLQGGSGVHKAVTVERGLLTNSWTKNVAAMEAAIGRFAGDRRLASDCQVVLFEIAGDEQLHVNVIHHRQHPRVSVRGWSGPGELPDGRVYNRRFADAPADRIIRHIRDMVFA